MRRRGVLSVVFKTPEMHIPLWYWFSIKLAWACLRSWARKPSSTDRPVEPTGHPGRFHEAPTRAGGHEVPGRNALPATPSAGRTPPPRPPAGTPTEHSPTRESEDPYSHPSVLHNPRRAIGSPPLKVAHYQFGTPTRAPELGLASSLAGRSHQPVPGACRSRRQSTLQFIMCGVVLVLQRRVVLQGNSWADFEAGNERVRVSHDERSVAEEEDLSVFSHNASL